MNPLGSATLLRATIGRIGPGHPTSADMAHWASTANTERAIPLLFITCVADPADLSNEQRSMVLQMQLDVAAMSVRVEHAFLPLARRLDDAGITFAVLKGVATAHLDYPDPSWRQFGDVDLLVSPVDLERACTVLGAAGWKQAYALPARHRRFTHAVTLRGSSLLELDVHQHVGHRALGLLMPTEELLAARVPYEIAGQQLWALSDIDRLIHACIHMVSSRGSYRRLSSVADVLLLSYLNEDDAAAVVARADRWRVRSLVRQAIVDAWGAAQLDVPDGWLAALAAPGERRHRLVERAYLGPARRPLAEELAYLAVMPGWRDRASYLWGHVAPGADYRAAKGRRGIRAQLSYLWQRMRSR